jgi:hypothetical protein
LAPEITGKEEAKEQIPASASNEEQMSPEVMTALHKLGIDDAMGNRVFKQDKIEKRPSLLKSPSEYLPMIRRGFGSRFEEKEEEPVVSVGWKVDVRNRKEREESLRYVFFIVTFIEMKLQSVQSMLTACLLSALQR